MKTRTRCLDLGMYKSITEFDNVNHDDNKMINIVMNIVMNIVSF